MKASQAEPAMIEPVAPKKKANPFPQKGRAGKNGVMALLRKHEKRETPAQEAAESPAEEAMEIKAGVERKGGKH